MRSDFSLNTARGQLNRKTLFSLSPFTPENLVSRDKFGRPRPASASSFSTLRLNLVLTRGIPPAFAAVSNYLYRQPPSGRPELPGRAFAYRWRSLPRFRRHRANSPKDSLSNGCYLSYSTPTAYVTFQPIQSSCCVEHVACNEDFVAISNPLF